MNLLIGNRTFLFLASFSCHTAEKVIILKYHPQETLTSTKSIFISCGFKYSQRFQLSLASQKDCALEHQELLSAFSIAPVLAHCQIFLLVPACGLK